MQSAAVAAAGVAVPDSGSDDEEVLFTGAAFPSPSPEPMEVTQADATSEPSQPPTPRGDGGEVLTSAAPAARLDPTLTTPEGPEYVLSRGGGRTWNSCSLGNYELLAEVHASPVATDMADELGPEHAALVPTPAHMARYERLTDRELDRTLVLTPLD